MDNAFEFFVDSNEKTHIDIRLIAVGNSAAEILKATPGFDKRDNYYIQDNSHVDTEELKSFADKADILFVVAHLNEAVAEKQLSDVVSTLAEKQKLIVSLLMDPSQEIVDCLKHASSLLLYSKGDESDIAEALRDLYTLIDIDIDEVRILDWDDISSLTNMERFFRKPTLLKLHHTTKQELLRMTKEDKTFKRTLENAHAVWVAFHYSRSSSLESTADFMELIETRIGEDTDFYFSGTEGMEESKVILLVGA